MFPLKYWYVQNWPWNMGCETYFSMVTEAFLPSLSDIPVSKRGPMWIILGKHLRVWSLKRYAKIVVVPGRYLGKVNAWNTLMVHL